MRVAPYFDVHLPYPPTFNTGWRCLAARVGARTVARMVLSARQRTFRKTVRDRVLAVLADRDSPYSKLGLLPFTLEITIYPPNRRRFDLDNLAKPVLDALMAAGVFEDDSQCQTLTMTKSDVDAPTGSCWVTITALGSGRGASR